MADFETAGTALLGVSPDPVKKQTKFAEKHGIAYPLLADTDHAIAEAYGVWKEKSFMGRKYMGVDRATFLIDRNGILRGVWPKVSIAGHPAEVLAAARGIGS